jgi:integrase
VLQRLSVEPIGVAKVVLGASARIVAANGPIKVQQVADLELRLHGMPIDSLSTEVSTQIDTLLDTFVLDRATGERRPHRNAALYHIAIRCGLREGELLGLRWVDWDALRSKGLSQYGAFLLTQDFAAIATMAEQLE